MNELGFQCYKRYFIIIIIIIQSKLQQIPLPSQPPLVQLLGRYQPLSDVFEPYSTMCIGVTQSASTIIICYSLMTYCVFGPTPINIDFE
jgi:hypothetical protein